MSKGILSQPGSRQYDPTKKSILSSRLVTSDIIQTEALIHLSDLLCQELPKEEATVGTTKENKLLSVQKRNK